jgi:chromosomal replication initiation ATPase DnaA
MNARREKLALALKLAKQQLNESGTGLHRITVHTDKESQPPLSKMNRLLGKQNIQDQRQGTLLQRTGVVERPTFDVVADKVLGKESKRRRPAVDLTSNGDSLADIAARRIRSLRQRTYEQIEKNTDETEDGYFGMEEDGRPVWERILDDQRGRATLALPPELAPVDSNSPFHHEVTVPTEGAWPQRLRPEIRMSFKQWFTTDENFRATQAAEAVVDSPAGPLNPLVFVGPPETGRSHLLHATAQAVLRRQEGNVYLLSVADLSGLNRLPEGWQDTLANARLLAIDDLHEHVRNPELAHELGTMLDYALNMGVHVILSSNSEPEDWPTSRLWELTRNAASVHLDTPKPASMVLYARSLAQKKGFMMDDGQLTSLVFQDTIGWRATKANFDLVALALQSGQEILDGEEVTALLSNQRDEATNIDPVARESVEHIASRLIHSAVDTVYSDTVHGGIDLYSELPQIGEDTYTPPEIDTQALTDEADARHAAYLKIALEDTVPAAPSVLALHEREEHLITRTDHIEERDHGRAADLLTDLDEAFDSQINAFERDLRESSVQLAHIEAKLVDMYDRTPEASMDELISIADELRAMEGNLTEFDPERDPWPEMEEIQVAKKGRTVGRQKAVPTSEALESHEPKGEWNIDAQNVDMLDLLEGGTPTRMIRLGRINTPAKLVQGEEE